MKIKKVLTCLFCLGTTLAYTQVKKWSLEECITHALTKNISIQQSELDAELAKIDKLDAIGSFLPSLNVSASNFWQTGLTINPLTNTLGTATSRNSSYGVNVGVNIFDGLRNVRQFQRAKLNAFLSQYNLGKSKDDIALFIANSYLQVLLNKESLKVIEKQQKITLEQLERTERLVEAGTLPKGDVLEIRATQADEQTRMVQARNAVQISLIALAQSLLLKEYQNFDIVEQDYLVPVATILETPVGAIVEKARASRYEVKIAKQNKVIAEKDLAIARGVYYPTLSGSFGYNTRESGVNNVIQVPDLNDPFSLQNIGTVSETGQNVVSQVPNTIPIEQQPISFFDQLSNNDGISYGLQLAIPVFNGFAARNGVKRSKLNIQRTQLQLEQAELDLDSNVYKAYLDAQGAAEAYEAASITLTAREEAYDYAKSRYDVGLINAFDLSQSRFRLENAMSQQIQTKFDYIFKIKVLELYFGVPISDLKL